MTAETTTAQVLEGVDLSGRTALVTGASAGLGVETVRALQSAGCEVVGAVRDLDKGHAALAAAGADCDLVQVDLADLDSVRKGAVDAAARLPHLDFLVNNAGIMACPLMRTAQGFEMQLGTNHLGHFVWTNALVPQLGEGSRVVNLSSRGHFRSPVRWEDPHFRDESGYEKWKAYGQSKTANILFSVELDRRLSGQGIRSYSLHPGVIMTELSRHLTPEDSRRPGEGAPDLQERRAGRGDDGVRVRGSRPARRRLPRGLPRRGARQHRDDGGRHAVRRRPRAGCAAVGLVARADRLTAATVTADALSP